ncbi:hypothetical protein Back11_19560 [Paenibacillus baekrokdamisoli]|uniref:Uncharacterized protein n=1 Tax=Paenibacillus baekrokdamisoli TaxID=1712516 RepID=A0A3G9J491_9BACL|nr:hypothetical protein [Paenibacillus baekrokdamisoli]MBB3070041.1 hypothetical protein [Paenibacillus baekrokdamisoli]BBH20611.1 hypothetical protein Back11_19560 [Paenibacillus baekrokdamisoli]
MVKSKINPILFIMICAIALSGCSKDKGIKSEDIVAAIESQDVKLVSSGLVGGDPMKLNEIIPEIYSIEKPVAVENDLLNFYVFNTEKARIKGVKEFHELMDNAKFTTFPLLYEKANVLIVYWSKSKDNTLLNKPFVTALEKL